MVSNKTNNSYILYVIIYLSVRYYARSMLSMYTFSDLVLYYYFNLLHWVNMPKRNDLSSESTNPAFGRGREITSIDYLWPNIECSYNLRLRYFYQVKLLSPNNTPYSYRGNSWKVHHQSSVKNKELILVCQFVHPQSFVLTYNRRSYSCFFAVVETENLL